MTKAQLLQKIHAIIWRCDDMMEQDDLFELQELVDEEICLEANQKNPTMRVHVCGNGYLDKVEVIK